MNVHHNTIVIQTQTVPTFKDHLTVLANVDFKEMVFTVKVGKNCTLTWKHVFDIFKLYNRLTFCVFTIFRELGNLLFSINYNEWFTFE